MRLFLPVRPTSTIRCGRSTSANVTSRPAEAVAGRLDAKARAGPAADRVDPRQVPVDQVVVGELGVVGDVLQVVEHLLARSGDDDRDGHGVHGEPQVYWPRPPRGWPAPPRRRARAARLGGAGGEAHGVAVLAVAHDLAGHRRLAAQLRHSSQTMPPPRPSYRCTCSPISGVRPQSTQRWRSASRAPTPRRSSRRSSCSTWVIGEAMIARISPPRARLLPAGRTGAARVLRATSTGSV